jgi:RNA polymerase sigma factor (sigma-70 family)
MKGDGLESDGLRLEPSSGSLHQDSSAPLSFNETALLTMVGEKARQQARTIIIGDDDEVDEIAAKVTISIWREIEKRPELASAMSELDALVFTATGRRIKNSLRDRRRARLRTTSDAQIVDNLPSRSRDPHATLVAKQIQGAIDRALNTLNDSTREAICLHHFYGYQPKEIAAMYGVPVKTADSWLLRGKQALRRALEQDGYSKEMNR